MVYRFSKTPEPPERPLCAADPCGEHEPLEMTGSDLSHVGSRIACDDGGMVIVSPCRKCALMYYRVMDVSQRIEHEIKSSRKLSEEYLKARIEPRDGSRPVSIDPFIRKLLEAGTIERVEQDDGIIVYVWKGDP